MHTYNTYIWVYEEVSGYYKKIESELHCMFMYVCRVYEVQKVLLIIIIVVSSKKAITSWYVYVWMYEVD